MCNLLYAMQRTVVLCVWSALLSVCVVSCTDEDNLIHSGAPVSFSTGIWGEGKTSDTRVVDQTWSGNEQVGVYMLAPGVSNVPGSSTYSIYSPTNSASGTSVPLSTSGTKFYYPASGNVNFVAFSPYQKPTTTNTVTYTMTTTSNTRAAMEAMDLIYCKTTKGYNASSGTNKDGTADLEFTHQFSKIEVTVNRDDASLSGIDFKDKLTLSLNTIPGSVTFDLNSGTVTSTGAAQASNRVTFYKDAANSTAGKVVFMAIVAPHTNAGTLTFDGIGISPAHTYKLGQKFDANTRYQYEFTLSQQGVSLIGSKIIEWTGGKISWNDDYYIQVESDVTIPKEAGSHMLSFATDCPKDKITIRKSSKATGLPDNNVSWITLTNNGDNPSNIGTNKYGQEYTVTVNSTGAPRAGYLHITAGTLTAVVKITQDVLEPPVQPEANCYILPPGGHTIRIPVSIIKTFNSSVATLSEESSIPISSALYAFVVWSDVARDGASTSNSVPISDVVHYGSAVSKVAVSGTGTSAYIEITSGEKAGNTVVAVANNGSDVILWSWHIWVTDFNPNATARTYTSTGSLSYTTTFMDRNLGATSATPGADGSLGLLYQWGRKDPFTGATSPNDTSERKIWMRTTDSHAFTYTEPSAFERFKSDGNLVPLYESMRYPYTFYWRDSSSTEDGSPTEWSYTRKASVNGITCRWLNTDVKAIDDPCPPGWKVSDSMSSSIGGSIWAGVNNSNFVWASTFGGGRTHSTIGWWPACGFRDSRDGQMRSMQEIGRYSSAKSSKAGQADEYFTWPLRIENTDISLYGIEQVIACSVRCSY